MPMSSTGSTREHSVNSSLDSGADGSPCPLLNREALAEGNREALAEGNREALAEGNSSPSNFVGASNAGGGHKELEQGGYENE
jgi:hypothetical protein